MSDVRAGLVSAASEAIGRRLCHELIGREDAISPFNSPTVLKALIDSGAPVAEWAVSEVVPLIVAALREEALEAGDGHDSLMFASDLIEGWLGVLSADVQTSNEGEWRIAELEAEVHQLRADHRIVHYDGQSLEAVCSCGRNLGSVYGSTRTYASLFAAHLQEVRPLMEAALSVARQQGREEERERFATTSLVARGVREQR